MLGVMMKNFLISFMRRQFSLRQFSLASSHPVVSDEINIANTTTAPCY